MTDPENPSACLTEYLSRMRSGDLEAREKIFAHFGQQLQRHAHRMLRGYPGLVRWVQTEDVHQNAMIRLLRALEDARPESAAHFFSLAALQIRRELIDLARQHFGPEGSGTHRATNSSRPLADESRPVAYDRADGTLEPSQLAQWAEFHEQIQALPEEERQVVDLLWYQEMSQPEAARLLGLSERTLKRRWQAARLKLHEKLQGKLPE
jgi:RNA polymerase sigma-70 factor (ECF subfamily)